MSTLMSCTLKFATYTIELVGVGPLANREYGDIVI